MNKDKLIQDRDALLRWMDMNDAHFSLPANEELRIIDEQLAQIHST